MRLGATRALVWGGPPPPPGGGGGGGGGGGAPARPPSGRSLADGSGLARSPKRSQAGAQPAAIWRMSVQM